MTDLIQRTPWPRRLWAPARIHYPTSLGPDEIVVRLADQSQGYAAPRKGNWSKIGYRVEVTPRGFKLFKVAGRFLGSPARTVAVLEATTSQTGSGTVVNGEVRLPYPYLTMFCIIWLATIATTLLPARELFVAALVLWGGFGSLFTLAQRVDAGRSVSTFVARLEAALGAPLAISLPDVEIPTAPHPPPALVSAPLFRSRMQAGIYLAGISAFWGGFLILSLMMRASGGRLAADGTAGPAEIVVFVLTLMGGFLALGALGDLLVRATHRTMPTAGTPMRMVMPATLIEAARKLGLSGPTIAAILYLVLIGGIVSFVSALSLR